MLENVDDAQKDNTEVARDILRKILGAPVAGQADKAFCEYK